MIMLRNDKYRYTTKLTFRGEELMVKVIKYGQKRRVTCKHCGALLEFEKSDIKTVQVGMNENEQQLICPACGETVVIS